MESSQVDTSMTAPAVKHRKLTHARNALMYRRCGTPCPLRYPALVTPDGEGRALAQPSPLACCYSRVLTGMALSSVVIGGRN